MKTLNQTDVYIWEEVVSIPTYEVGEGDLNPMFLERRVYQGSSGRVYPLPVTETISDEKQLKEYNAVFLENSYLKVMVLPSLGGRIQRALDKTNGYEFVYYNRVIKPALVGLAGPWISGGIEFNWPQHHRPSTFMPVEYSIEVHDDGSKTLWVGETDIMYGTKGMAGFTLYPETAYIEVRGQLYNGTAIPQTFLWWANPAVAVNDYTYSVFPPDVHAVMDHGKRAVSTFPIATGEYYKFDYSAGIDISRYKNIQVPTSYMAYQSNYDFIGSYDESLHAGLLHVANHHISPGKKQWTWGNGDFGQSWDRNLTDEDGPYIEMMTGVFTDNQPDFTWLKPQEEKTFTQYFMPYKQVGRVSQATKDIALRYERVNHTVKIVVYATTVFNQAKIQITLQDQILFSHVADLSPERAWEITVPWEHPFFGTVITVTSAQGELLLTYEAVETELKPVPKPAEALLEPNKLKTTEELYLAAMHLIQYRHASYDPVDYFLEGLRRDPSDIRLNNGYGLHLYRQGRFEESQKYFDRAITKLQWKNPNPYNSEALYNCGLSLWMQGKYEQAYPKFYKATWSAEMQNAGFYRVACLESRRQDYRQALEHVEQALVRNWHDMKSRLLKSILLRKLGEDVRLWLEESQKIDLLDLGIAYEISLEQKEPTQWKQLMRSSAHNYLRLASTYEEMGFAEEAFAILSLCPVAYPMISYAKGYMSYIINKDEREATRYYQAAEKISPNRCFPNTLSELQILSHATKVNPEGGLAHYYLGNLLYHVKRYTEATDHWQQAAQLTPEFSTVHRNLSIAYYNQEKNGERAFRSICRAQELDTDDARILLERDQLAALLGQGPRERLAFLENYMETVLKRDDLYLQYIFLLNCLGQYQKAYNALMQRNFHPWEGGEGKVSGQYVYSLIGLALAQLERHDEQKAIALLKQTWQWPRNLGEGRLPHTLDTIAQYHLGEAYAALGQDEEAIFWWEAASKGIEKPSEAHYYNEQPSDTIFYQGLACQKLGQHNEAKKRFHTILTYGEQNLFEVVEPDYFAVSLPETTVYHTDRQWQHEVHCRYHRALGLLGLGQVEKAVTELQNILVEDPSHQGVIKALALCEKS